MPIDRRAFLQAGLAASAQAQQPPRPNLLLFRTDQQRYDTIGALGNPHIRTPNLDKLVNDGVAFTNTYCQTPICTPSRASFFTGCYASSLDVNRNGNEYFPDRFTPRLLPRILKDAGYRRWLEDQGIDFAKAYGARQFPDRPREFNSGIAARHHEVTWCAENAISWIQTSSTIFGTMRGTRLCAWI
ncbi:MAG: sulfatase-like hydrolase/transferase [Bryobacteraceae bacterium]|nr:sulfatase-like hydrolase/transferase [Bryobacteraceae bacterium]